MPGFDDALGACTSGSIVAESAKYVLDKGYKGVMTWNLNTDKPEYTGMAKAGDIGKLVRDTLDGKTIRTEDLPVECPVPPASGQCDGGKDDESKKLKCTACSSDAVCGGGQCDKEVNGCGKPTPPPAPTPPTPPTPVPGPGPGPGPAPAGSYYCDWYTHTCRSNAAVGTKTKKMCSDICTGSCANKADTCDPTNDACCPGLMCKKDDTFGGFCVTAGPSPGPGPGPSPGPGPGPGPGPSCTTDKCGCYTVASGDSCGKIADKFGVSDSDMRGGPKFGFKECSEIRGGGSLQPNDKLTIHNCESDCKWPVLIDGECPACFDYYVESGDNCYALEDYYGVPSSDITKGGEDCDGNLQVGDKLVVCHCTLHCPW